MNRNNIRSNDKKYRKTVFGKSPVVITSSRADIHICKMLKRLAREAGCGVIDSGKTCAKQKLPETIDKMAELLRRGNTHVLIDLQLMDPGADQVIQIFANTHKENQKYAFLRKVVQYSFEYEYRDMKPADIVGEAKEDECGIAVKAARKNNIVYLCIRINRYYCNPSNQNEFAALYHALSKTVNMLSKLDWKAKHIEVYRLWQSAVHKPQDKVELSESCGEETAFAYNSLLNVCAYGSGLEKVRLHKPGKKTIGELKKSLPDSPDMLEREYIFLTNRLIELLYGREWIEGKEETSGLMGAPVILYENEVEDYPIGMPKANQIDRVSFSTELFKDKKDEAEDFDYVLFNRYTDSRLYIDFEKADYGDFGRVKDSDGLPAKKVMIPRYYKKLLGYLDKPLQMIRSEEYEEILTRLEKEEAAAAAGEKAERRAERESLEFCYEKIDGEIFHALKEQLDKDDDTVKEHLERAGAVQDRYGLFRKVELLRVPKEVKPRRRFWHAFLHKLDQLKIGILKKAIGRAEYLLKTEWTSETDDRNNIARLNPNMMSLLGISENDKILVKFGKKHQILRVLANDSLTDYQIGIPAIARKKLGMNSINDIVIVHRDMLYIFQRHSEEQMIAILGTVLAVYQVFSQVWLGVLLCLLLVPVIMYFVLNEERIKVK